MPRCLILYVAVVKVGARITILSVRLSSQPEKPAGINTEGPNSSLFRLIKTFAPQKGLMALIMGQ